MGPLGSRIPTQTPSSPPPSLPTRVTADGASSSLPGEALTPMHAMSHGETAALRDDCMDLIASPFRDLRGWIHGRFIDNSTKIAAASCRYSVSSSAGSCSASSAEGYSLVGSGPRGGWAVDPVGHCVRHPKTASKQPHLCSSDATTSGLMRTHPSAHSTSKHTKSDATGDQHNQTYQERRDKKRNRNSDQHAGQRSSALV